MEQRPRRRRALILGGVLASIAVAAALLFAPWRLLIDVEVRDADPFAASVPTTTSRPAPQGSDSEPARSPRDETTTTATAARPEADPVGTADEAPVRVGTLRSIAHTTSGQVRVGPTPDGRQVVYIEDLATDNGPDVRVLLSPHPADGDAGILGTDRLELGPLKGNIGDQTYEVPAGVDLGRYQSVVLWCERFSVGFGVAALVPA